MTCIAGLVHGGRVYLAGDSFYGTGTLKTKSGPKVFKRGAFVIGCAGGVVLDRVLRHEIRWPRSGARQLEILRDLPAAVRRLAKASEIGDDAAIVGHAGKLWELNRDGIEPVAEPYYAIGSGGDAALGALAFATYHRLGVTIAALDADRFLRGVLRAVAKHRPDVCGPFRVVCA